MHRSALVPHPESKRRYEEGWRCFSRAAFDEAERHFRRGLKLARRRGDRLGEAHLLNGQASVALERGYHALALEICQEALRLFEACGDRRHSAMVLGTIGNVYLYQRRFEEAEHRQRQALALNIETKSFYNAAVCAHNVALCLLERGQLDAALAMFLEVRVYYPKVDPALDPHFLHSLKATVDQSLAVIYYRQGERKRAQRLCLRALSLSRAAGERLAEAECLLTLGIYSQRQRRAYLEAACVLSQKLGAKEILARTYRALAELHRDAGHWKLAWEHLEACYQEERQLFNPETNQRIEQVRRTELLEALESAKRLREAAERTASQDSLTGLANRRYIDQRLAEQFQEAQRCGTPLAVALFDIDNFKNINDTLSHAAGDEVLRRVAQVLTQGVRPQDVVGRYGGEEFVVLLPGVTPKGSLRLCERLRRRVAATDWSDLCCGFTVTVSGGICADASLVSAEKMLQEADRLLYQAKAQGKNLIETAFTTGARVGRRRRPPAPLRQALGSWGSGHQA